MQDDILALVSSSVDNSSFSNEDTLLLLALLELLERLNFFDVLLLVFNQLSRCLNGWETVVFKYLMGGFPVIYFFLHCALAFLAYLIEFSYMALAWPPLKFILCLHKI